MTELYIGLLSGTSMDGIDVAAVDYTNQQPNILASECIPYPNEFRTACHEIISSNQCHISDLGQLDHWAGELFADAALHFISKYNVAQKSIRAIGSHGQTIWHAPDAKKPFTMQIGDPNVIAVKTGIATIADFRRADIAAGGQGAPFAPAFHQAVFSSPNEDRCIVNIGGISNISVLSKDKVVGFDSGPGNCLMDLWVKKYFNIDYDQDGEIAKTGTVCNELLSACLADAYFAKPAPKSTGREYFNFAWLQNKLDTCSVQVLKPVDVLATLTELTAKTISTEIKKLSPNAKVYICGGGAYNPALLQSLSTHLNQTVKTTLELGIDPSWVEAALFAWLAKQTLASKRIDLRHITGSKQDVVLGGIYGYCIP